MPMPVPAGPAPSDSLQSTKLGFGLERASGTTQARKTHRPDRSAVGPGANLEPNSGRTTCGDPEHVRDAIAQMFPLSAVEIHVAPSVVEGGDGQAGEIARKQLEHERASAASVRKVFPGVRLRGLLGVDPSPN